MFIKKTISNLLYSIYLLGIKLTSYKPTRSRHPLDTDCVVDQHYFAKLFYVCVRTKFSAVNIFECRVLFVFLKCFSCLHSCLLCFLLKVFPNKVDCIFVISKHFVVKCFVLELGLLLWSIIWISKCLLVGSARETSTSFLLASLYL